MLAFRKHPNPSYAARDESAELSFLNVTPCVESLIHRVCQERLVVFSPPLTGYRHQDISGINATESRMVYIRFSIQGSIFFSRSTNKVYIGFVHVKIRCYYIVIVTDRHSRLTCAHESFSCTSGDQWRPVKL